MMQDDRIAERLREAASPEPTPALRRRVLAAAAPGVRPDVTWADRVWFSRRWRLAAVVLLVALLGLDRISVVSGSDRAAAPGVAAVQTARAADEVARQVGLAPDQADAFARRALIAASRPTPRDEALGLSLAFEQPGRTQTR